MNVQLQNSHDGRIDRIFEQMINHLYVEGQLQKNYRDCLSCSLTQRNVYQYCPAPLTKVKKPKKKNKMDPVEAAAIGVGGLALVAIGIGGILLWNESRKRDSNHFMHRRTS
jgi:hypothetical protein